jgi:hypothetical protein
MNGRRRLTIARLMGLVLACGVAFAAFREIPRAVTAILVLSPLTLAVARMTLWLAEIRSTKPRFWRVTAGLFAISAVGASMFSSEMADRFLSVDFAWGIGFVLTSILEYPIALFVGFFVGAWRWRPTPP